MERVLKREVLVNRTLCRLFAVVAFILLTALAGLVRIPLPFTPVPLTLQTFFVLLAGAFLGSSLGAVTQLSYIFLGLVGLPVFSAAGSGLFYLLGPTGGYLAGFILAAFFAGRFIRYGRNLVSLFFIFSLADLLLLSVGTLWLEFVTACSLTQAFVSGFLPFLFGDMLKAIAAAGVYLKLKNRIAEIF